MDPRAEQKGGIISDQVRMKPERSTRKETNRPKSWLLPTEESGGRGLAWKHLWLTVWWIRTVALLISLSTISMRAGSSNQDERGRRSLTWEESFHLCFIFMQNIPEPYSPCSASTRLCQGEQSFYNDSERPCFLCTLAPPPLPNLLSLQWRIFFAGNKVGLMAQVFGERVQESDLYFPVVPVVILPHLSVVEEFTDLEITSGSNIIVLSVAIGFYCFNHLYIKSCMGSSELSQRIEAMLSLLCACSSHKEVSLSTQEKRNTSRQYSSEGF